MQSLLGLEPIFVEMFQQGFKVSLDDWFYQQVLLPDGA